MRVGCWRTHWQTISMLDSAEHVKPSTRLLPGCHFVDVNVMQDSARGDLDHVAGFPATDFEVVGNNPGARLEVFLEIGAEAFVGAGEQVKRYYVCAAQIDLEQVPVDEFDATGEAQLLDARLSGLTKITAQFYTDGVRLVFLGCC